MEHSAPRLASAVHKNSGLPTPRQSNRLFGQLVVVFHHACDDDDFAVAEGLLRLLETIGTRPPRPEDGLRRPSIERLVAANERLWHLRNTRRV